MNITANGFGKIEKLYESWKQFRKPFLVIIALIWYFVKRSKAFEN
jgi:hypothetical protein